MAAYLTHPGYRADGLALIRRVLPQRYAANDATPAAVLARDVGGILTDGDPRAQTPPLATLMTLDWAGLKPTIANRLSHGANGIVVVRHNDEVASCTENEPLLATIPPPTQAVLTRHDIGTKAAR